MREPLCREKSLALDEPLLATASVVQRWILIERDGPWGANALQKNRFDPDVQLKIRELGQSTGARLLLIRRHGKRPQTGVRVMCSYTSQTQKWLEEFHLDSIDELFDLDLSPLKRGASVGGKMVSENQFFVCTHGKHDPCCAKYGMPVAIALDREWPERTWETSHIGGDRFAGNVLVLPLGIYYGRVQPSEAVTLMQQLDRGQLSLDHYRGQSAFAFRVQAAEWWARKEYQWLQLEDLSLVEHLEPEGDESLTTFITRSGKTVEVRLIVGKDPARKLTCRATNTGSPPRYQVRSVTIDG
ncbi:MAG TPA: sucrase ferredoxin [Dokdonella sp.]|uniref:sucrase ferredoxin n=1 Tax=Dokdonella sp. TaxID=2291710 RepID=UPI002D7EFC75|nr:sucrase ferredoxin [Dokdonella sp.]HET9032832.1 sucrase ferredoxin [Dokdonella sp.]